ncbi:MAG: methyltransferase domain-containing protein [Chlamydiae bacterium]|nr:methyltransferase domain-containing protein [Chlamydiota bacterium]
MHMLFLCNFSQKGSMRTHYQFSIHPHATFNQAFEEAITTGIEDIYTIEDMEQGASILGGYCFKEVLAPLKYLTLVLAEQGVDWKAQSEQFSPYYQEGIIRVPLQNFNGPNQDLVLHPGEGFGDLSHPTTDLCLKYLSQFVSEKIVIDIGTGNGILSCAASLMGAQKVYGIDICNSALQHAKKNQELNRIANIYFSHPDNLAFVNEPPSLALMNMTFDEQKLAWESLGTLKDSVKMIISSGILSTQEDQYRIWLKEQNISVLSQDQKDIWSCFILSR